MIQRSKPPSNFSYIRETHEGVNQEGFLHSRRDPIAEARRIVQDIPDSLHRNASFLIVGIGWGYVIEELASNIHSSLIFALEPIPQVFQSLEKTGRLQELSKRGLIFHHAENLQKQLREEQIHTLDVFVTPVYKRLFPDLADRAFSFFQNDVASQVDRASSKHFLRQWTRNAYRLTASQKEISFVIGTGKEGSIGSEEPLVVYCGSGPRLLEEARKIPKGALILSSDTALAPLLSEGIEVDLALSIDSGRGTIFHLSAMLQAAERRGLSKPPVLGWTGSIPSLSQWFPKTYYYRSTLPLDQILGEGPLQSIPEWKNPSRNLLGIALQIGFLLGSKRLYLAGCSFVSEKGIAHERGTGHQTYALSLHTRKFSLEMHTSSAYSDEMNPKNRMICSEAQKTARLLGIQFRNCSELNEKECAHKPSLWKAIRSLSIPVQEVHTYLDTATAKQNLKQLESFGLNLKTIKKYRKMTEKL